MEKYTVYSDLDFSEQEQYFRETFPDMSDTDIASIYYEALGQDFDYMRSEFDQQVAAEIIAIADIGRWDGRFVGYKSIPSGNLKDCFDTGRDIENAEWYVDKYGDLRSEQRHHDGTHFVLYRGIRGENTYEDAEHFKHLIYTGKATAADVERYTERVGDTIAERYGWEIDEPPKPTKQQSLREMMDDYKAKVAEATKPAPALATAQEAR